MMRLNSILLHILSLSFTISDIIHCSIYIHLKMKNNIKCGVFNLEEANLTIAHLENMKLKELYELAEEYQISYYSKLTKKELIFSILKAQAEQEGYFFMEGVLDIIQSKVLAFYDQLTILRALRIFIFPHHKFVVLICEMGIKYRVKFVRLKKMNVILVFCMWKRLMAKTLKLRKNVSISLD